MLVPTIVAVVAVILTAADPATALDKDQLKCQATVAKEGGKFLKTVLKERQKCALKNLKQTGSCDFAKRAAKLAKAETRLRGALQKKCTDAFAPGLDDENLATIGFPGKCGDADPSDRFTGADLQDCLVATHAARATALFDLQFGANGDDGVVDFLTRTGDKTTAKALERCQKEVTKSGTRHALTIHKEIRKCRDGLLKGTLEDFDAVECGNNAIEPKPAQKIASSRTKNRDKILGKCADAVVADPNMDLCDTGSGPAATGTAAADCIVDSHGNAVDDPENLGDATPFPMDLIDIAYASAAICGDGLVNEPAVPGVFSQDFHLGPPREECDRNDDASCPGACGAPDGSFACQCTNTLRARVIAHDNADLDQGWSQVYHDTTLVEGTGYLLDVYDCDGPGGPDTACTIGPSCALPPHAACVADSDCAGGGNACRKTGLALGPHCNGDVQTPCDTNADCPAPGDFCRKTMHGPPQPYSAGGVTYCTVNIFEEDVTGTTDLGSGEAAYHLRQKAVSHLGSGTLNQPCPSCGGFCSGDSGGSGPGDRWLCAADSDCPASATCVTDAVCSYGPREDQPCRRTTPFGNPTALLGTPSVDCPPAPGLDVTGGGLDIEYTSATTGTLFTVPSFTCNATGFEDGKCIVGSDTGRACTADTDCAGGGAGSCAPQCFCPSIGGPPQKPNDCQDACRGGSNDYAPCGNDTDCPGGLCEMNSCRLAAGSCTAGSTVGAACAADSDCGVDGLCGDPDSTGEGFCPAGLTVGRCSTTTIIGCLDDAGCRPSGTCSFCLPDNSEVCVFKRIDCFPTTGYTRTGTPGFPDRVDVAHYCVPAAPTSFSNLVDIPAPGALEVPITLELTP